MGWLIAAGIVLLLAILPVGISAIYNANGPLVRVIAGPIRFTVFPAKKKEKKPKPQKKKEEKKTTTVKKKKDEKSGGSFRDFMPLIQPILDFLDTFRRKLRVKRLEMKVVMAADDPCDLAVNYGKAWAAVGNIMPHLERWLVIKKRDVEVECDFTADKTLIFARLDLTITIGRLLSMAVVHGVRILRQFVTIMKIRKGGANK